MTSARMLGAVPGLPPVAVPLCAGVCREIPEAFMESLILAQDERWRRA